MHRLSILVALVMAAAGATAALAVTGSDFSPPPPAANQSAYAAGIEALEREDWPAVIAHLGKVVDERPWDDDAHNLLGYAYRQQEQWDLSLMHYNRALALNPHHRGALEYLGEAYLELGRPEDAQAMRERLEQACRRVYAGEDWPARCEEWQDLQAAFDDYHAGR
jgi:tetratricopeptide (TPR) repeat protein